MRHVLTGIFFPEPRVFRLEIRRVLGDGAGRLHAFSAGKQLLAQTAHRVIRQRHPLPGIHGMENGKGFALVDDLVKAGDEVGDRLARLPVVNAPYFLEGGIRDLLARVGELDLGDLLPVLPVYRGELVHPAQRREGRRL